MNFIKCDYQDVYRHDVLNQTVFHYNVPLYGYWSWMNCIESFIMYILPQIVLTFRYESILYVTVYIPVSGLPVWVSIVLMGVVCIIYTSLVGLPPFIDQIHMYIIWLHSEVILWFLQSKP